MQSSANNVLNQVVANMHTMIHQDDMQTDLVYDKFTTFVRQLHTSTVIRRAAANDQKYMNNITTFCNEAYLELRLKKRLMAAAASYRDVKRDIKQAMHYNFDLFAHSPALLLMLRHTCTRDEFIYYCCTGWADIFRKYHNDAKNTEAIIQDFRRTLIYIKYD
jgi:hypothetical protein